MISSKKNLFLLTLFVFGSSLLLQAQHRVDYNLVQMLQKNKLDTTFGQQQIKTFFNPKNQAISVKGILWLKGMDFKEGTVDIDLRGKDILLQSFIGIAFHAKDTTNYEVVYFCPFRFRDTNAVARKWAVKYMSVPDNSYEKLRKDHPGVYENSVEPPPHGYDWFHATIEIKDGWISVYVNNASTPSLKVKKLDNTAASGKIGLWSYGRTLDSDFANLSISR